MKTGIYKIFNKINNKIYIGSSINLNKRKYYHFYKLSKNNHSNKHLQSAYNKYGKDNFKFEIIEYIQDKNLLLEREQYWIDLLNSCNDNVGYNILPKAGNSLGYIHSKSAKKKISKANSGKNNPFYGKNHSESTKIKISKSKRGTKMSNDTKNKISNSLSGINNPNFGKQISMETKKKISIANTGKKNINVYRKVKNIDTNIVFDSITEASEYYDIPRTHISSVCNGKRKTCGGYKWLYI